MISHDCIEIRGAQRIGVTREVSYNIGEDMGIVGFRIGMSGGFPASIEFLLKQQKVKF